MGTLNSNNGELEFIIDTIFYYQCSNHSNMTFTPNILKFNRNITNTTADGNYNFFVDNLLIDVIEDFSKISVYCYYHGYMGGENIFRYNSNSVNSEEEGVNLNSTSEVKVINSGGNKYVFNGENSYNPNRVYLLSNGTYKLTDIPYEHPIAILNNNIQSNKIIYTPNTDFTGSDSFTYKVNDGNSDSNTATVSITINNTSSTNTGQLISLNNSYGIGINSSLNIELESYPFYDNLNYVIEQQPSNGTISGSGETITYIPNNNYQGLDSLVYSLNDNSKNSNKSFISILIGDNVSGSELIIKGIDYNQLTENLTLLLKNNGNSDIINQTQHKLIVNGNILSNIEMISSSQGVSIYNNDTIIIDATIISNQEKYLIVNTQNWNGGVSLSGTVIGYKHEISLLNTVTNSYWSPGNNKLFFDKITYQPIINSGWNEYGPKRIDVGQSNVTNILENKYNTSTHSSVCGAIDTVWTHPSDSNIVIIGAVGGGIWKTKNAKNSGDYIVWENKSDEKGLVIRHICSDINNSDRLVACTGHSSSYLVGQWSADPNKGVLVSTDGGENWIQKRIIVNGKTLSLDLSSVVCWGNKILTASHRFGINNTSGLTSNDIYGGLYLSTDFGNSWVQITNNTQLSSSNIYDYPITSLEITKIGDNIILYAGLLTSGVYKSTDEGISWNNISLSTSFMNNSLSLTTNNNLLISACRDHPEVVYVIIVNQGRSTVMAYTTDSGLTWNEMNLPKTFDNQGTAHYLHPMTEKDGTPKVNGKSGSQGAIHLSLYAHPTNSNIIYAGGDRQPEIGGILQVDSWTARLFRGDRSKSSTNLSTLGYSDQWSHITNTNTITDRSKYGALVDGGTINNSAPHADSRGMIINADGNLLEVDDGGIYMLTDCLGKNGKWYSLIGQLNVLELHSINYDRNNDKVISGAQDNGTSYGNLVNGKGIYSGDGGDVLVGIINSTETHLYYSAQRGYGFGRTKVINGILNNHEVINWIYGKMSFKPVTAINRINSNKIAVNSKLNDGSQIYICNLVSNIENKTALDLTADSVVEKIIYGHQNNEDILYAVGSNLNKYINGNKITYTRSVLFNNANISWILGLDIHNNNEHKVIITSGDGYNVTEEKLGTNTDDNRLVIVNTDSNTAKMFTTPYNKTYTCIFVNDNIFIGHSRGVSILDELSSKWKDVYNNLLPDVAVVDMVYDSIADKLVIGTMGRGSWYLNQASQYNFNTESEAETFNSISTSYTIT